MKFCYLDESGTGEEPILVIAGIVVDAYHMHVSKSGWDAFLSALSKAAGRPIAEFHAKDFYNGRGPWFNIDGNIRASVIGSIIDWISRRSHQVVFAAIEKSRYDALKTCDKRFSVLHRPWCAAALHVVLGLQKKHQSLERNKGHTVIIFDNADQYAKRFVDIVREPPGWTDDFYGRKKKQEPLDQLVDVPYFVDSRHALLIQVADLMAYIIRCYTELGSGLVTERYDGEKERMTGWFERLAAVSYSSTTRWPKRQRTSAQQLFWDLAPSILRGK